MISMLIVGINSKKKEEEEDQEQKKKISNMADNLLSTLRVAESCQVMIERKKTVTSRNVQKQKPIAFKIILKKLLKL